MVRRAHLVRGPGPRSPRPSGPRWLVRGAEHLAARFGLGGRRRRLPVGGRAEPRALEHLQRQQGALHARRGDLDPEQVQHERAVEPQQVVDLHALDLVGRHRGGRLADRAAVALEADVVDRPVVADAEHDLQLVAAQRVVVGELEVGVLHRPPVVGALVVLEDLLAVEVVHQAKTSWTLARPAMSASTSSGVLCTPKDAREVAATPRRRISGWQQWWPARTQTPSRPRISATSCGWTPSSANDTAGPRGSSSGP